jgi:threonine dehydrogenase-like Zn-dependent dehydrogenase
MKACFFDGILKFGDVPEPVPAEGEVLIRVLVSAICNTDLEIVKGYMGFTGTLGHEFVGEVVSKSSSLCGKKVVGEINCACGKCYLCTSGRETHCPTRKVLGIFNHDGAFAEYVTLPEKNLHVVPESLSPESAVFTEPLAAALEIFQQVTVLPGQNVFIFGAGKLGLLIASVFHLKGFDYKLLTRSDSKVNKALSIGLKAEKLESLVNSAKAEICVDCTGNPEGVTLALSHLYPGGKLILKTTVAEPAKLDLNELVINEFTLFGSRCGPFAPALDLLNQGLVDPAPLVTKIFSFSDILNAFKAASMPENIKILIDHRVQPVGF